MGISQWQRREEFKEGLRFFLKTQPRDRQVEGFTLLELIVISVMVGILAALAIPSFFGYLNRQELNAAQQELLQGMRRAQSEARRRQETFQLSITTISQGGENLVAIAVHPADIVDMEGGCALDPMGANGGLYQVLSDTAEIAIEDANSNLGNGSMDCNSIPELRQRFNSRGEASVDGFGIGRITLQLSSTPQIRRCVIVSTILGALRTDIDDGCT
ncbi:MAG: hypothetical protein AAFY11_14155 [Cyanobacteria bacterium J06641_5]